MDTRVSASAAINRYTVASLGMVALLTILAAATSSRAAAASTVALRARALEVLYRAGCVAPDPEILDGAEAILAVNERSGSDGVRRALGCAGPSRIGNPAGGTLPRERTRAVSTVDDRPHASPTPPARLALVTRSSLPVASPSPTPTPSGPPDPDATASPSPTPTNAANTSGALFGTSVTTDYTAKHFSFIAGAAVLNRFKLTPSPVATAGAPVTSYTLGSGSTVARAFLEGNVRYRWAWLDRLSGQQTAVAEALASPEVRRAAAARDAAADAHRAALAADPAETTGEATAAAGETATAAQKAQIAYSEALERAYSRAVTSVNETRASTAGEWPVTGMLACMDGTPGFLNDGYCIASQFVPQDVEARLGYVFDSGSSSTTAGIPAASDIYGGLSLGWNLVRWSFPTSSWLETPLRGSINFEPSIAMVSDSSFNDIHEQYFVGASTVIGVPIRWTATPPKTIGQLAARDKATSDVPLADPVVEFIARIGASRVDVPVFLNQGNADAATSNLIKIRHGQPDFRGQWGLGVDFEFNVPVPNNLGYVVMRGMFNAELDPDPWALQIGYTIPFSNLLKGIGATNP